MQDLEGVSGGGSMWKPIALGAEEKAQLSLFERKSDKEMGKMARLRLLEAGRKLVANSWVLSDGGDQRLWKG